MKPGTYAHFETSMGNFTIELFEGQAPKTVANFVELAEGAKEWKDPRTGQPVKGKRFYDGLVFGTGMGGPGYRFPDEINPELKHDNAGILSMANAGPNTNGSQFFITLGPTPHLNGRHTVFGHVVEGLDVVRQIGKTKVIKPGDRPVNDVVMKKITIERVKE